MATSWTTRALGAPALHMLVIGVALLAGDRWLRQGPGPAVDAAERTIVVTAAERARLGEQWAAEWGAAPTAEEERALVDQLVDDEVLFREALALGLDRGDRVVRTRLAQVASFVGLEGDDETLAEEARRLGLDRSDLVVRRYLIQNMRLVGGRSTADDLPTEDDVEAWFARHADRFREPERMDVVHVYLSRDRRGARLEADAQALLARLLGEETPPEVAPAMGDPFIRGSVLRANAASDLERAFGSAFATAVAGLPVGGWHGPVPSAYGLHVVHVAMREPGGLPPLASVRNQVVHGLLKERQDARLRERLATWRRSYVVVIEGGDA